MGNKQDWNTQDVLDDFRCGLKWLLLAATGVPSFSGVITHTTLLGWSITRCKQWSRSESGRPINEPKALVTESNGECVVIPRTSPRAKPAASLAETRRRATPVEC